MHKKAVLGSYVLTMVSDVLAYTVHDCKKARKYFEMILTNPMQ